MAEAFVYCWTDHETNMLYLGVHKGVEQDGYISSSKYFNGEYTKRISTFSRQIIASGTYKDMLNFETTLLQSINAAKDVTFYNRSNGSGKFYCTGHTNKTRQKMSNTWKQKQEHNCDHKKAIEAWRGQKHNDEARQKMRGAQARYSVIRSGKMIENNPMRNPEAIIKMLETRKKNKEKRNVSTN